MEEVDVAKSSPRTTNRSSTAPSPLTPRRGTSPAASTNTSVSSSELSSPARRAAPEVEERWREASGLKSPDEVLVGDFQCSYTGDLITSMGRLYLSTGHLCFYSSLGAISMKKVVVAWSDITSIEKTLTNYDHSSGIKVTQKDGPKRHFTQFSSRDKVYDTMVRIWTRCLSKAVEAEVPAKIEATPLMAKVVSADDESESHDDPPLRLVSNKPPKFVSEIPKDSNVRNITVCTHWVEPSSEPLRVVELPYSIDEFVSLFLDDNGAFFNSVHESSGLGGPDNMWIKPYPATVNECCVSRDFNFQQPITTSFPLAPSTTRVKQVHRWFSPTVDQLFFSTSSMMPDIPYGSSFSIESKWKVKEVAAGQVSVTVHVEGNFLKWLFGFKTTVESLIKKDGVAYVEALLGKMTEEGRKKADRPLLKSSGSFVKPVAVRSTPPAPRLTPPPKKSRQALYGLSSSSSPWLLYILGVLVVACMIYIVILHRNFEGLVSGSTGSSVRDSVISQLKGDIKLLKVQLDNVERLLEAIESS